MFKHSYIKPEAQHLLNIKNKDDLRYYVCHAATGLALLLLLLLLELLVLHLLPKIESTTPAVGVV